MSTGTIVVGAGMVGVSVAWHLARRGHDVTLVDRRAPGRETSFGNAGIIQREAVRPYPFPRDLGTLWRVLPNRQVDIRYRPGGMLEAAGPLWQYWKHSAPSRYARIVPEYASLIARCLDAHGAMIEAAGAHSLVRREGWLEVYRRRSALEARLAQAEENAAQFGVRYRALDDAALADMEPSLGKGLGEGLREGPGEGLAGAIHWLDPWTVADPGALVSAYAEAFEREGGRLVQAEVEALSGDDGHWRVATGAQTLAADSVVLALGPWSRQWLSRLGVSVPLFPKRGYHMHYASRGNAPLDHWIMDAEVGYLLAPMRAGIRLTTGAELERLEAPPHLDQLAAAEARARELYPLGERLDAEAWKGARPCTPDMKPVIGPVEGQPGLWCAFGHGHQGFTLGPATGELLAQMMAGEAPAIDMRPFRVDRF